MNYAAIKKNDIANGPGVRVSLFVSGCRRKCPGCFNAEAQSFDYGAPYTPAVEKDILKAATPTYVEGLSLLGGEPFEPENREELARLCTAFKARYPQKSIWCYTGFTAEELLQQGGTAYELLKHIDVLVDGRFDEKLKNAALIFRGSENQRIIDIKKTLAGGCAVIADGKWERTMGSGNIEEA